MRAKYSILKFILLTNLFLSCINLRLFSQDQSMTDNNCTLMQPVDLSEDGILLNTCWKFHKGDDMLWANTDFDDSRWEYVNPAREANEFKEVLGNKIGWFRLQLLFDSSIKEGLLVLRIQQNAASEIYVDGKLAGGYGILHDDPYKVKAYNPLNQPLPLSFSSDKKHVIAVRIGLPKQTPYLVYPRVSNDFFNMWLGYWSQQQQLERSTLHNSFGLSLLKAGVFIIVLLLHFAFYFFYKREKVNLWLGVYDIFTATGYVLYALLVFKIHDVETSNVLRIPASLSFTIGSWFLILATYSGFGIKKGFAYWLFFVLMLLVVLLYFTPVNSDYAAFANPQTFWYPVLASAESIRLSFLSLRRKNGAINPLSPVMIFCVLSVTAAVIALQVKSFGSGNLNFIFGSLISLALLGLPISFFMYVAIEFKFYYTRLIRAQALRNKIALDLHDDLGTKLSTARMFLKSQRDKEPSNNGVLLDNSIALLDTSINDLRNIMNDLHEASTLIENGYLTAAEELINKIMDLKQINFTLTHHGIDKRLEQKTEYNLYRITQELINNTLKYGNAKNVSIDIVNRDDKIIFMYEDDGNGFDTQTKSKGFGLSNIASRAQSLGGKAEFDTAPGAGFRTIIELPLIYA